MSVLPYGPGWGANTPGGVASCMTWDTANGSAFRESRLPPYRPASASISSGETPYFLKPNLSYERRMRGLLLGDPPSSPHPALAGHAVNHSTQTPESSYRRGPSSRGCDARHRQAHRRCGGDDDDDQAETWASCNRCSDVVRATSATDYNCERCCHDDRRPHQRNHQHLTPRPPRIRKEVQFAQENNNYNNYNSNYNNTNGNRGRVIEILEDRQGNPVKLTVTRPSTAINRPYSAARENRDQNERWAARRRYVQTDDPEMTSTVTGCDAEDLKQIVADDVRRLMQVYQAGKADASFHKGRISPKWSSNAKPERLEEVFVEEHRQNVTTSGNRWPDDGPIRPGYPERRGCYGPALQESRTVVSRLHRHGVRRDFPGDVPSQNDKVKVQVECPANADTVVNLRVRASDVDYQFR